MAGKSAEMTAREWTSNASSSRVVSNSFTEKGGSERGMGPEEEFEAV